LTLPHEHLQAVCVGLEDAMDDLRDNKSIDAFEKLQTLKQNLQYRIDEIQNTVSA